MRILFMTTSPLESNSSASIRNIALIKGLTELGHEVSIVAPGSKTHDSSLKELITGKRYYLTHYHNQSYSKLKQGKWVKIKKRFNDLLKSVFHSFNVYDRYKIHINKLTKLQIWKDKYDVIITSSDPKSSHLLGKKYIKKSKSKVKWIQYWGDPIYLDITNSLKLPDSIIRYMEHKIISKSSVSVYVSPITFEEQMKLYPKLSHKMHFIHPPYLNKNIYLKKDKHMKNFIRLGYYGAYHSRIRNIKPLYETIKSRSNIQLEIIGNSDLKLNTTQNIFVSDRVTYDEIKEKEKQADILICICNLKGTQIPGKIYQYAATNKPVLLILDGDYQSVLKSYFEKFNRFYICENNSDSIEIALNNMMNNNTERIVNLPLEQCSPTVVAQGILKTICSSKKG